MKDISGRLGEYMLKGWVLTDRTCQNSGCNVPLMRSPSGRTPVVHYCASCDENPDTNLPLVSTTSSSSASSSASQATRISTPPTEISSGLGSPTFVLPPETGESRRRREQSDMASVELGKRLLQGWAMLGDECPNTQCFGVPLVRPPKTAARDSNKECVICGSIYVTEIDWAGRERLVLLDFPPPQAEKTLTEARSIPKLLIPSPKTPVKLEPQVSTTITRTPDTHLNTTLPLLRDAIKALEHTLQMLTLKLTALSDGRLPIDPLAISNATDAISKTTQALSHVKQLEWSEMQNLAL
ncbi:uncharacterized protein BT62DRAFT_929247 [Guyanagaster necrorhizus]|uniref:Uncharacterized protein n=1 Tax=Guyanagaster necrorhizus TaxID=856835 RepID=A0A9P7VYH2_9AGAR|nr:uncharacterized protein BT62DRAFT_929247 [Guyanagaster necrorhizus MCA 3950]KAG7449274.1 hypothetical protein BT62DRAFT_929247 [Guyanagaster necrorhizus MCA 3950]